MREALESEVSSQNLPQWIDLMFGYKQRGKEAKRANNLFHHLTYIGPTEFSKMCQNDRDITLIHIENFGKCPGQLFNSPHPSKIPLEALGQLDEGSQVR